MLCLLLLLPAAHLRAQSAPEMVGRIEGDDIAVKGQVSLLREGNRSATVLSSGAEITVRTGAARITLEGGGEIEICSPAHFTVLKSGGSITLALGQGRVHLRLGSSPALVIYTALLVAAPLGVGDGPREAVAGVEADGSICILAARGAVRLEQQLTGQSLVVPENGEVLLPGGQLDALRENRGGCRCEARIASAEITAPKPAQVGVVATHAGDAAKPDDARKEPPKPATEEPRWTVVMPPLTFDASKPPPALEPRPETILLVREVRVQPALVFTGRVEKRPKIKAPKKQKTSAPAAEAATQTSTEKSASEAQPPASIATPATDAKAENLPTVERKSGGGFGTKLRNFFRRLFGAKPKN
ncbi:MAG: hypothetical protein HY234_00075 [Acidobacteria bacterium]|nr:hypothetical protein [Acidobacteriota bacterium]MBI3661437.1 hypothetical protein [Acidobacteriota bacterium]